MLKLFRPRKGRTNPGEGGRDPSEVAEMGIGREQIFAAEHLASSFGLPDHFKRDEVISPHGTEKLQSFTQLVSG